MRTFRRSPLRAVLLFLLAAPLRAAGPQPAAPVQGGALPGPLPLFPSTNWWNLDVSAAPLDPGSAAFIAYINNGGSRRLHPDFGGDVSPGSQDNYGLSYAVVDGTQPKKSVLFDYSDESDGVDHTTDTSFPFYPIPDEAITQAHWVEGGPPGNVDLRGSADRHLLIVDKDNRYLYELYNVFWDGTRWLAGSGAFFDLGKNDRRPDGWTSADAAGLAILPGLVRYDEVYGSNEIGHAFRFTVRSTNGYVHPASHRAGSTAGALPMGARLRLKAAKNISSFAPEIQRIFRAFKKYGLIVADNGSDMYISGTYDTRWDNDVLNPAFAALTASDFEVVQLGWNPPVQTNPCSPGDLALCLNQSRFQVQVTWKNPYATGSGSGHAVPVTADTGTFWFFSSTNVELVVKVLDGRAINGKFWVFYGALSDVEYTITVTDTQTGAVKPYYNPPRNLASAADTSAF